jgi:hypothetical protein
MLAWSVKSVPGCLVLIVPRLIGLPVAATPGLGPHELRLELTVVVVEVVVVEVDVLAEVPEGVVVVLVDGELVCVLPDVVLVVVLPELLPHPASATATAMHVTAPKSRPRGGTRSVFTSPSSNLGPARTSERGLGVGKIAYNLECNTCTVVNERPPRWPLTARPRRRCLLASRR